MLNSPAADQHPDLPQLLPELLQSLCEKFRVVECEFVPCPNLHERPFRSAEHCAAFLGPDLSLVSPSTSSADFGKEIVCQFEEGTVVTKASSPAEVIRIQLEHGPDWKSPIRDLLNSTSGPHWLLLCVEARSDSESTHFHLLSPESEPCEEPTQRSTVLIAAMKPEPSEEPEKKAVSSVRKMASMFAKTSEESPSALKKPTKLVRKVAKPPSPTSTPPKEDADPKAVKKPLVSTKTIVKNGTKIVKKKIVDRSTPKENTPDLVQEVREEIQNVSYVVRLGSSPAPDGEYNTAPLESDGPATNEEKEGEEELAKEERLEQSENGEKEEVKEPEVKPDSSVETTLEVEQKKEESSTQSPQYSSEVPTVESQSNGTESCQEGEKKVEVPEENGHDAVEVLPPQVPRSNGVRAPAMSNGSTGRTLSCEDNSSTSTIVEQRPPEATPRESYLPSPDFPRAQERPSPAESSASITSASIAARLASIRNRESSAESGDGAKTSRSSGFGTGIKSQLSNDVESDLSINDDSHSSGFSEALKLHMISPASAQLRTPNQMPIIVLQKVLKFMSYEELGRLRQVTPLWDELCGQMMNTGYYNLTAQADRLLTECQRKVHREQHLAGPIQVLTNLQVHVINPVDVMRVAMDEGVCCFPYGKVLDKAFEVLEKVKEAIRDKDELDIPIRWEHVAELSRRAQVHYKVFVEGLVEERMGEVLNLKAQQRIQRIDSFMIESTVSKLERVATQAKDDLHWEMEQLKAQNAQLRKDNRDIKRDYMKLESRVEVLERKFKTVARLLQ